MYLPVSASGAGIVRYHDVAEEEQVDAVFVFLVERNIDARNLLVNLIYHDARNALPANRFHSHRGKNLQYQDSLSGIAKQITPEDGPGYLAFGIRNSLPPGSYRLLFRMKRIGPAPVQKPLVRLDILSTDGTVLAETSLAADQLPEDAYVGIPLNVKITEEQTLEPRVYSQGITTLRLSHVETHRTHTSSIE